MSDFTPTFTHPHLHSPNHNFLNDHNMLSPSNQFPKSADYIKIHDQDTNSSASKDHLAQSNRSNPHAFPHELTFHPSQEPPRSILRPIQDYNNMMNPRVHYSEKPGQNQHLQQENIEGGGLGMGLISGFLKETFKQDNSAMSYLNKFSNIENIPQGVMEVKNEQKQVKRPPKYQPPKAKPAGPTNIHNRSLQSVQEEQSREEDEELRPYNHIPQPTRVTRAEKQIAITAEKERSRSNSKERKLEQARKASKSPERFPGEDQAYEGLKRFYKNIVVEKKVNRKQKMEQEKDALESALFGDDKENFQEAQITTKRSEIQTTSATHKPSKSLQSSERQVGLILRQSPRSSSSSRQELETQQRIMLKDERDVIGKGVTWLTTKHPWKVNVLKMTETEMAEALEVMKTEKDWRGKVTENIEGIFEMPEESVKEHVNSSYDLEENAWVIEGLLGMNRSIVFYYVNFLQKFSHIGILKEIADNKGKIKKLNMGLSKLKRENNKIKKVMTDEVKGGSSLKKASTLKKDGKKPENQLKRTSYQENETKIMMMTDIRSRLMQKNVLLVFKWLSGSTRIRNELLNVLANAYNRNLLYHVVSGMYFSTQLGFEKRRRQFLVNNEMRKYWLKELMGNWREQNRLSQLKREKLEDARDFFVQRLKRRGFYGILIQIQYKKTLKADDPLVNKFREYQFTKKMFLAFKYNRRYSEVLRDKRMNPQVNYSSKPMRDPREKTISDCIVKDSQKIGKVILNKLMILSSKRDYYYEPLRKMKTLLTPKYATHYPQAPTFGMNSPLTPMSPKSPNFLALNKSYETRPEEKKAFIYKKKKYALDKLTHENAFIELKEHIRLLVTTRHDLEDLPITLAEPPRGMINVQSLERFYEEREEKRLKATFLTKWKTAFLDKWTNLEADLYHSMYLGKAVIQKMRSSIRQGKELERGMTRERTREMMRKVFGYFKQEYMGERNREDMLAYGFQKRKWMECWKLYYAKRKAKRELYRRFSANYYYQLKEATFKRLRDVTRKNQNEREFRHHQIQKRAFNLWIKKFNNRVVLGNVFGEFTNRANHYVDYVPKNNFQLLSSIMRAWRHEVIDNEHTADQKINNLVAKNHRIQTFVVKVFRAWREIPSRTKSLALMTRIFKGNFRKNVFKKWSYITQYTLYRMATLQESQQKLKLYRCFQALYKFSLQQKLIRAFQMRRIFLTWRASFHLRTQIFPRRCHTQYLSRAFFNALKDNRKKKILHLKQKFLAQQQYKRITLPLMGKVFYRFVENMMRNKKKKGFYDRLTIFRMKTVMRGIMKAWRGRVFQRIVKQKKIRLAEEFKEDRQALWTQPQNNKKTIIARYQMLNLAFSGWRASALKSKNEKHIIMRFRKFRERIDKRSLFNHWYQQYRDRRINSYQLPSLNISFSKYLKTDAHKMHQYGGGKIDIIDSKRSFQTPQWEESRSQHMSHTRSVDFGSSIGSLTSGSNRDLWMTSYQKNEEFMRKLNDMKEMEKKSFKKYF